MSHKLHVKNMVCNRCIEAVREEFDALDIPTLNITLGEVVIEKELPMDLNDSLQEALKNRGFELLQDQKSKLIDQIKSLIIEQIHYKNDTLSTNFSTFIEHKLDQPYHSLSKLFSQVEGMTIERFILKQKIEKVRELIFYGEHTLSEIAYLMHYSSVAHLSAQFKKETGMTPSEFKKSKNIDRKSLDQL